jgi:O-antigen ligase
VLKETLRSIRLTHISLTLVGVMWVFPFLHNVHQRPITTFYPEWWAALLGVMALALLTARDYWRKPEIPRIALMPVALIAVVLLHWSLGKMVYFDQALMHVLYLLFAALLMLLGAALRDRFGIQKLAVVLAVFLTLGAEINAVFGILQHYLPNITLNDLVLRKITPGAYGNIAQSNNYANYITLGLISIGLLFQQRKLKISHALVLTTPMLLALMLSGSRSSWLYLLMMAGMAWWYSRKDAGQRPLFYYSLLLLAGYVLTNIALQLLMQAGSAGVTPVLNPALGFTPAERIADVSSGSARLYMWREAAIMFMQSPWLGVGFGQFAWHHFQLIPELRPDNIMGLHNNAHNIILQLAAETGLAGLLAVLAPLLIWLRGLYSAPERLDAAHWWATAVLSVIAIHSLLEYPLWYVFFIGIAATLLGALDETRYRSELRNTGRVGVIAALLLGLLVLAQVHSGYAKLEQTMKIMPTSPTDSVALDRIREGLVAVHGVPLLSPYAEYPLSGQIVVNGEYLKEKLALNTRVLRASPKGNVAYRQAMLLAQNDQQEQAREMMEMAILSYPTIFTDARWRLTELAKNDPERFSALLEFAIEKHQEYQSGIHRK